MFLYSRLRANEYVLMVSLICSGKQLSKTFHVPDTPGFVYHCRHLRFSYSHTTQRKSGHDLLGAIQAFALKKHNCIFIILDSIIAQKWLTNGLMIKLSALSSHHQVSNSTFWLSKCSIVYCRLHTHGPYSVAILECHLP